jgi:hypothetical protein
MKKGNTFSIIALSIMLLVILGGVMFFGLISMNMINIASYVVWEFPNSSSPILSGYERTYKADEEVVLKIKVSDNSRINSIRIDEGDVNYRYTTNGTFSVTLDTSIDNGNSKETKSISINGWAINGANFTDKKSYELVMSTEEALLNQAKKSEDLSGKANRIAWISIILSCTLFVLDQIINLFYWKRRK